MNIFFISNDPCEIARQQVDKHAVKMILESAQMLSTAHRLIDGKPVKDGKKVVHLLPGETIDHQPHAYKVAHAHHPSTVWTMASISNYQFHAVLFQEMLREYDRRYPGKVHSCRQIANTLAFAPRGIAAGPLTVKPQAMPDQYKTADTIEAYRRYYAGTKYRFAKWKHGEIPGWFFDKMAEVWAEDRESLIERGKIIAAAGQKENPPMDKRVLTVATELCREHLSTVSAQA